MLLPQRYRDPGLNFDVKSARCKERGADFAGTGRGISVMHEYAEPSGCTTCESGQLRPASVLRRTVILVRDVAAGFEKNKNFGCATGSPSTLPWQPWPGSVRAGFHCTGRPAKIVLGGFQAPFPPAVSHRLLLSSLTAAIE